MKIDPSPVFRRGIVPWYDTEGACLFVLAVMFVVFLFGYAGFSVARTVEAFQDYAWVPVLVMALSAMVIVSTTIRLFRRYMNRH